LRCLQRNSLRNASKICLCAGIKINHELQKNEFSILRESLVTPHDDRPTKTIGESIYLFVYFCGFNFLNLTVSSAHRRSSVGFVFSLIEYLPQNEGNYERFGQK
jgi:hypothetical protein